QQHGFTDENALRVLFVSTRDVGGGAEYSAWNLFDTYRKRGIKSRLAVGTKRTDDPHVVTVPNETNRNGWARVWIHPSKVVGRLPKQLPRISQLQSLCHCIGEPLRWLEKKCGYEDFNYPGAWKLLDLAESPDIVHCYNLHDQYFDLRVLPWLSQKKPVILDL